MIFYTLDQRRPAAPDTPPVIERRDFCLQCHNGNATSDVPGMVVRSIVTMPGGQTAPRFGNYVSDHRSPFDERWAGWYVTGAPGSMTHLGNAVLTDREHPEGLVTHETLDRPRGVVWGQTPYNQRQIFSEGGSHANDGDIPAGRGARRRRVDHARGAGSDSSGRDH